MNIIKKFKTAYYQKLIDDHIVSHKYEELRDYFSKLKKHQLFIQLEYFINKYIHQHETRNFFKNKIFWINSYDLEDIEYVNHFIQFYFSKLNLNFLTPESYLDNLSYFYHNFFNDKNHLTFDDLLRHSYSFQYLISLKEDKKINFLNSQSAFFSSNFNNFTHHHLTNNFIYIVRNPVSLFKKYKELYGDSHQAMSGLFNYENLMNQKKYNDGQLTIDENRQSWAINVNSWTDNNVKNTFRGYILKIENLISNPEEKLSEIVSHLSQSYLDCKLNYNLIDEFININPPPKLIFTEDISNQQKKIIRREIEQYDQLIELEYDI